MQRLHGLSKAWWTGCNESSTPWSCWQWVVHPVRTTIARVDDKHVCLPGRMWDIVYFYKTARRDELQIWFITTSIHLPLAWTCLMTDIELIDFSHDFLAPCVPNTPWQCRIPVRVVYGHRANFNGLISLKAKLLSPSSSGKILSEVLTSSLKNHWRSRNF